MILVSNLLSSQVLVVGLNPTCVPSSPRYRRCVRRRAGVLLICVFVVAELMLTLASTWTQVAARGRIVDVEDVPRGSTALVLGSLVADGQPGDYVRGRLDTAVQLYRSGVLARIVDSGNGRADAGDEPAVMRAYLERSGVPAAAIADDLAGFDTAASCRRARDEFGVRRAVIVTQDFHLPRAIALCRHVGVAATGVPARCECSWWTLARNHFREDLLARPKALLSLL